MELSVAIGTSIMVCTDQDLPHLKKCMIKQYMKCLLRWTG